MRHLVSKTIWQQFTRIYFVSELNGALLEKTFYGPWVPAFHLCCFWIFEFPTICITIVKWKSGKNVQTEQWKIQTPPSVTLTFLCVYSTIIRTMETKFTRCYKRICVGMYEKGVIFY